MATVALVPVAEYLATTYHPDCEFVDGELVERHVGEHDHSRIQALVAALLIQREGEGRFRVFTEQRVQVAAGRRYRIPDVCVMALPYRHEPVLTQPPHLAVEIRSPEDRMSDILARVADFLAAGIPHVWLVDPYKRTVQEFGPDLIRQAAGLALETELVGRVEFAPLFHSLDEPTE